MARYVNIDDFITYLANEVFTFCKDLDATKILSLLESFAEDEKLQMYREVRIDEDGNQKVAGYRFGEPWVAMALYTEGGFKTEREALMRWYQECKK